RPRPIHIALPLDLMTVDAPWQKSAASSNAPHRNGFDAPALAGAATLLSQAERPVLILGGGAVDCGAAALAIAERIGAAVLTTIAGKGIIPDDHRLHAGSAL